MRAIAIAAKLERLGVKQGAATRAQDMAAGGQITRSHFSRLLIESGVVKDNGRAFKRYLGQGRQAYVSAQWAHLDGCDPTGSMQPAAVAVLAHPFKYPLSRAARHRTLKASANLAATAWKSAAAHRVWKRSANRHAMRWNSVCRARSGRITTAPSSRGPKLGRVAPLPATVTPISVLRVAA